MPRRGRAEVTVTIPTERAGAAGPPNPVCGRQEPRYPKGRKRGRLDAGDNDTAGEEDRGREVKDERRARRVEGERESVLLHSPSPSLSFFFNPSAPCSVSPDFLCEYLLYLPELILPFISSACLFLPSLSLSFKVWLFLYVPPCVVTYPSHRPSMSRCSPGHSASQCHGACLYWPDSAGMNFL